MIRILMGGSPCTHWSIAQKNNRETQPNSGIGWELFKNYLIAKEKFKPDYFLYENNVSAAQPIKDEIKKQLGVWDGTFLTPYSDVRYIEINSALVSAQNRERFYVHNCGEVGQPKDRGILLKDILESGVTWKDKQNTIDANYFKGGNFTNMQKQSGQRFAVAEPCIFQLPHGYNEGGMRYGKTPTLTANGCWQENNKVVEPIQVGAMPTLDGEVSQSQGSRIYDINAKSVTLKANGGGGGAKTGLYAVPVCVNSKIDGKQPSLADRIYDINGKITALTTAYKPNIAEPICYNYATEFDDNGKPTKAYCYADGKIHTVYEVKDGKITIKGKEYPIKLTDGYYIIRKLTVNECRRLQTIPDWYKMPCSPTQNYKMLGNGWTVEVIKHILSHIPEIAKGEPIEVLSMYDGMSCGRIALKELGANVVRYYATEIDKYAIQTTQANFPDTIQLGDAFQVREKEWRL
ncbi:MAG: DNA cytosine methyltransferase [Roseburia sp.]|nr:DNA cytosine methyltransferase [Roseburia sp.]